MAHPLAKHRDNGPFLMWGQRDADLLFVHMAPTYNEVRHKEIGQDFKFLMSVVNQVKPESHSFKRIAQTYAVEYAIPGDRFPDKDHVYASQPRLLDDIDQHPHAKVILVGRDAHMAVSSRPFTKTVNSWFEHHGRLYLTLYHPRDIMGDPQHFRNFTWGVARIFEPNPVPLHVPFTPYHVVASTRDLDFLHDGPVAVDIEATGTDHTSGHITCVGFYDGSGTALIVPQALVYTNEFEQWYTDFAHSYNYEVVMHNGKFDNQWLMTHLGAPYRLDRDTMLMHGIKNEQGTTMAGGGDREDASVGHGAKELMRLYLGWDDYETGVTYTPKTPEEWERLHGYLANDVAGEWELDRYLTLDRGREDDLYNKVKLYDYALTMTEISGVAIDVPYLQEFGAELEAEMAQWKHACSTACAGKEGPLQPV
jgi:uracil-DNA glycosylase